MAHKKELNKSVAKVRRRQVQTIKRIKITKICTIMEKEL